jgi:hypothetical protein
LSTAIGISGGIAEIMNLILFIKLRNHIATRTIYEAAIYSASQKNRVTIDYFLNFQMIEFPALINIYPVIE